MIGFHFQKIEKQDYRKIHSTLRERATNPSNPHPCSCDTWESIGFLSVVQPPFLTFHK